MLCSWSRLSACPTLLPYSLLGVPPHIRPIMAARRRGGAGVACHGHQPQRGCEALERLFNVPVIESYGMTEASMVTCNPLPPRPRKAGSVGGLWAPRWPFSMRPGMYCLWVPLMVGTWSKHYAELRRRCGQPEYLHPGLVQDGWPGVCGCCWLPSSSPVVLRKPSTVVEKNYPGKKWTTLLDHPAVAQAVTFAMPHTLQFAGSGAVHGALGPPWSRVCEPSSSATKSCARRLLTSRACPLDH